MLSRIFRSFFSLFTNPLLYKELNIGMRDRKIFIIQTIFLSILSVFLFGNIMESKYSFYPVSASETGKTIFLFQFWIQLILVIMIAPSLTSSSISSEKEKKTYELLIGTLLSQEQIISGKLFNGLSFIFLLLISSVPITATVFFLGGVSPSQVIGSYMIIFATGSICCQIGEFFSARENKTANATNQSYLLIFLFSICTLPATGIYFSLAQSNHINMLYVISYRFIQCPLWLLMLINYICLTVFLFIKTVNHIGLKAKNIKILNIVFIVAYLLNLIVLAAFFASKHLANDDIGNIFAYLLLINLFLLGFFGNNPNFPSKKESGIYSKSLLSHNCFFPAFLSSSGLIPFLILSLEPNINIYRLLSSILLIAFYLSILYAISRITWKIMNERYPFSFFYYFIFFVFCFVPLISLFNQNISKPESPFVLFHFISPLIVMFSLWSQNNFPKSIEFFTENIPIFSFSVGAYLLFLITLVILNKYIVFKRTNNKK